MDRQLENDTRPQIARVKNTTYEFLIILQPLLNTIFDLFQSFFKF